jgi:2-oxoglutarate dehydrogenase E1 component
MKSIQLSGAQGVREMVIGMAHRGRLNVLVNIIGKAPSELFEEFEGKRRVGSTGDVKYHMGFSSDVETPGGADAPGAGVQSVASGNR